MCDFELYLTTFDSPELNYIYPLTIEGGYRLLPADECAQFESAYTWQCWGVKPTGEVVMCHFGTFPWASKTMGELPVLDIPAYTLVPGVTYTITYHVSYVDTLAHTTYTAIRESKVRGVVLPLVPVISPSSQKAQQYTTVTVSARGSYDPSAPPNPAYSFSWALCLVLSPTRCEPDLVEPDLARAARKTDSQTLVLPSTAQFGTLQVTLTYVDHVLKRLVTTVANITYEPFLGVALTDFSWEGMDPRDQEAMAYHPRQMSPLLLRSKFMEMQALPIGQTQALSSKDVTGSLACQYVYQWSSPDLALGTAVNAPEATPTALMDSTQLQPDLFVQSSALQNYTKPTLTFMLTVTHIPSCYYDDEGPVCVCRCSTRPSCHANPLCVWHDDRCMANRCAENAKDEVPGGVLTHSVVVPFTAPPRPAPGLATLEVYCAGGECAKPQVAESRQANTFVYAEDDIALLTRQTAWTTTSKPLQYRYFYEYEGVEIALEKPGKPLNFWQDVDADWRAVELTFPAPMLAADSAQIRFGVVVKDRLGSEYRYIAPPTTINRQPYTWPGAVMAGQLYANLLLCQEVLSLQYLTAGALLLGGWTPSTQVALPPNVLCLSGATPASSANQSLAVSPVAEAVVLRMVERVRAENDPNPLSAWRPVFATAVGPIMTQGYNISAAVRDLVLATVQLLLSDGYVDPVVGQGFLATLRGVVQLTGLEERGVQAQLRGAISALAKVLTYKLGVGTRLELLVPDAAGRCHQERQFCRMVLAVERDNPCALKPSNYSNLPSTTNALDGTVDLELGEAVPTSSGALDLQRLYMDTNPYAGGSVEAGGPPPPGPLGGRLPRFEVGGARAGGGLLQLLGGGCLGPHPFQGLRHTAGGPLSLSWGRWPSAPCLGCPPSRRRLLRPLLSGGRLLLPRRTVSRFWFAVCVSRFASAAVDPLQPAFHELAVRIGARVPYPAGDLLRDDAPPRPAAERVDLPLEAEGLQLAELLRGPRARPRLLALRQVPVVERVRMRVPLEPRPDLHAAPALVDGGVPLGARQPLE
mmetsp:Transcript_44748/g.80174  ORF Transcript_44748/g.80174 Transcript_44748/m.80174 type:complete len:1037 (-) Transcript_44748:352-3462(-)